MHYGMWGEGHLIKLGIPQVPTAQVPPLEIQLMPTKAGTCHSETEIRLKIGSLREAAVG